MANAPSFTGVVDQILTAEQKTNNNTGRLLMLRKLLMLISLLLTKTSVKKQ